MPEGHGLQTQAGRTRRTRRTGRTGRKGEGERRRSGLEQNKISHSGHSLRGRRQLKGTRRMKGTRRKTGTRDEEEDGGRGMGKEKCERTRKSQRKEEEEEMKK